MQRRLFSNLTAYVGQTRSRELVKQLSDAGIGECVTRGQLPPRRHRWFYDNGAFEDFQAGREFDYLQWSRDVRAMRLWRDEQGIPTWRPRGGQRLNLPDFQVVPDKVGAGWHSLYFSLEHLEEARTVGAPCYLALQNGMSPTFVSTYVDRFDGLFVGGTLEWKLDTAATWVKYGRKWGKPVHVGRVGTLERVEWAHTIGATSIDSSLPLWTRERLTDFIQAVA
jgi:hypothetical protein